MKYPKLWDGPSSSGEAALRGLKLTRATYLSIEGSDFTAHKHGRFRTVLVENGLPYLWTQWDGLDGPIKAAVIGPEFGITTGLTFAKEPFGHVPTFLVTQFVVHVGDAYLLVYYADAADPFDPGTNYWPELLRLEALTPRLQPGDPTGKGKSIDFFDDVTISGMSDNQHSITLFASGWKDDAERFQFGCSFLIDTGNTVTIANELLQGGFVVALRQPEMFIGSTQTREIAAVTLPTETGRDLDYFAPFCVGRGKLQYLETVPEVIIDDSPYTLGDKIAPYLAYSTDHGQTWDRQDATWLLPYLAEADATWAPRFYYSNRQSTYLSLYHTMQYAGNGRVFTFIPNAIKVGTPTSHADVRQLDYRPYLFLGDAGSVGLTRVPWPGDDWPVNIGGFTDYDEINVFYEIGWRRLAKLRSAQFSFGVGCLYVPIIRGPHSIETEDGGSTTGWKIMFTRDWGATWTTATAEPPAAVQNVGLGCFAGTIIFPYLDEDHKGRILFTGVNPTTNDVEFWQTDGDFETYKRVWKSPTADTFFKSDINGDVLFDWANYAVNFGNDVYPQSVFPAFPGEFEKP